MDCLFNPSQCLERLHLIEEEIVVNPISPDERKNLFYELDEVNHVIEALETQSAHINRFVQSYLKELKEAVIKLYGKIDDSALRYRTSLIQKESLVLEEYLEKGDMKTVACLVDTLTSSINSLFESFSPTLEGRRSIAFARLQLDKASALMEGRTYTDPLSDPEGWSYLQAEEAIETIADLLTQNEKKAARYFLNHLTTLQRRLLNAYLNPEDILAHLLRDVEISMTVMGHV